MLAALAAACGAVSAVPARPRVLSMAAEAAAVVTRIHAVWRVAGRPCLLGRLLMSSLPSAAGAIVAGAGDRACLTMPRLGGLRRTFRFRFVQIW